MRVSIMNDVWYNSMSHTVARYAFQSLKAGVWSAVVCLSYTFAPKNWKKKCALALPCLLLATRNSCTEFREICCLGTFMKICRHISLLDKIWPQWRTLDMRLTLRVHCSSMNSYRNVSCREKETKLFTPSRSTRTSRRRSVFENKSQLYSTCIQFYLHP